MTTTGERTLVAIGEPVYSIFIDQLGAGTTLFQIKVNDQWFRMLEGDTLVCGDEYPTVKGVLVRTQPALPGIFSNVIVSGTPDGTLRRG
jgi:hypothetical protein